jgi:hypothetical protein
MALYSKHVKATTVGRVGIKTENRNKGVAWLGCGNHFRLKRIGTVRCTCSSVMPRAAPGGKGCTR